MKKLSDYEGEEAIELWGELLEPVAKLIAADDIKELRKSKQPRMVVASTLFKSHPDEIIKILKTIDPDAEITGVSVITAFVGVLTDIMTIPGAADFFQSVGQTAGTAAESIG